MSARGDKQPGLAGRGGSRDDVQHRRGRAAGGILRGNKYRGKFVCLPCLVTMTLERLHPGWRQSEIERAMDKVSQTPGAITYLPTFICALCQKTNALPRGSPSVKEARGGFQQTLQSP
jgi:hypothetical protein